MARIFLSHSGKDREQAARLLEWLHVQGFTSTFLDFDERRGIAPGADWERTLYREVSSADAVILILTKNWFDSKWCFVEFAQARALGKAIFPLVEAPTGETFVSSDIQHLDLVKDREGGLDRLRAELTRITINTRGGFPWDDNRSPFPGLLAFDEADAAIYFGRDDDIRRLIERINARRAQGGEKLIALLGASGSGKSSLLRAGAVPRLKRDPHNWIVLPAFRPQIHPLDELAQAIATGLQDAVNWRHWRAAFETGDLLPMLSDLARDLRATYRENEAQILLVIDQGEELFGGADRKQAEQFFRVLNALLDASLPFLAVMALRSDYLGRLQEASGLTASFDEFSLKPMPLERVRDIIEGPARVTGIAVDDALVTAAVADARTDDALPLLAFALRELYDRSATNGHLTVEAYRALGDATGDLSPLENAVRKKADEVLGGAKPAPEDLQALKGAFIPAMVRVNAEDEYVRRPADIAALPERALPLIERLAKARLLTIRKEQNATLVEVAHEALLRKWPLLRGWLDEEREFLKGKDQLEADLLDWERAAPEVRNEALLTGLKLTRARSWLAAKPLQLSEAERRYVQASIARHNAEAARRDRARRRVVQGSIAAAAVLALVAAFAIWEWRQTTIQKNQAVSRQLTADSLEQQNTDPERSILLAMRAVNAAVAFGVPLIPSATTALHSAILASQVRMTLRGHEGPVESVAFSPDGRRVVTASIDNTAKIWDAETGKELTTLHGDEGAVYSVAFSPDGRRLATASDDRTAKIWDAETGKEMMTLSGHTGAVHSVAFSPDGRRLATASDDRTTKIWDAETGKELMTLSGHTGAVHSVAFSPDGRRLATASDDRTAKMWDSATGTELMTLHGHEGPVYSVAFSPDGRRLATASYDETAKMWDSATGTELMTLHGHEGTVYSVAFSPDGRRLATASYDKTAKIWDPATGKEWMTLRGHQSLVYSVAFSPDGRRLATGSNDNTAKIWDAEYGKELTTLHGHEGAVYSVAFRPDGRRLATASRDHTAKIWDAATGKELMTLRGHEELVFSVAFSQDGRRLATGSNDKTAKIWDAETGKELMTLRGHEGPIWPVAFSPDGRRLATGSDDKTAKIWDAETGKELMTLRGHEGAVYSVAFSPDGRRLATASIDHTAKIWDTETGKELTTLHGHEGAVYSVAFSPDGRRLATASDDRTTKIWDAETGKELMTLSGHTDAVHSVAFSPDGRRLATASFDHTAKIWDSATGKELMTLRGHEGPVISAVFSPDGRRLAAASEDKTVQVYALDLRDLLTLAHSRVTRDLTAEECQQYLDSGTCPKLP